MGAKYRCITKEAGNITTQEIDIALPRTHTVKPICVKEDVMLLMIFLEQFRPLSCGFFGDARQVEYATSVQRQLYSRRGGHLSYTVLDRGVRTVRIYFDRAAMVLEESGIVARVDGRCTESLYFSTRNSGYEWHRRVES